MGLSREEIRRLQKAARDKNIIKLAEWGDQFEQSISTLLKIHYDKTYNRYLDDSFQNLLIALLYSLYYSEETVCTKENINDFMADFLSTIECFRTGEYKPDDFVKQLEADGITVDKYDYTSVYKEKQEQLTNLMKEYQQKLDNLNVFDE